MKARLLCGVIFCVGGIAHAAGHAPITFKVVKKSAGMTTAPPTARLLTAAEHWMLRDGRTWSGQNEREIFFTFQAASADAALPEVAVTAAGVEPVRVIVGKTDVPFTRQGDQVRFTLVRDTRNAMLLDQVLPDSEGGLPIHFYHNWLIRQDGPFRGKPVPRVEVKAVPNYLVAAREALKLMGRTGPKDEKDFEGSITLMSFEVACARGHHDYPPHVHVMLWVPGYAGGEVPHFYLDAAGRIVRNSFGILGDEGGKFPDRAAVIERKRKRNGQYGPGKPCGLYDLKERLAVELTITEEGGLRMARPGAPPCLLIADPAGADRAVLVRRGDKTLVRVSVDDDAEKGHTVVTIEHLDGREVVRTLRQELRYDPFTGLGLPATRQAPGGTSGYRKETGMAWIRGVSGMA